MRPPAPGTTLSAAALILLTACGSQGPREMTAHEVAAELRKVRIEPGQWRVESQVIDASGPNMPRQARARFMARRQSIRNCVTPERAAHPEGNFLRIQPGSQCTYRDFSTDGGRVRGWMRCTGGGLPGTMTTTMEGRHGPREYQVVMRMTAEGMPGGADAVITSRTVARRTGECAALPNTPGSDIQAG
jgi:hypothetical protein